MAFQTKRKYVNLYFHLSTDFNQLTEAYQSMDFSFQAGLIPSNTILLFHTASVRNSSNQDSRQVIFNSPSVAIPGSFSGDLVFEKYVIALLNQSYYRAETTAKGNIICAMFQLVARLVSFRTIVPI